MLRRNSFVVKLCLRFELVCQPLLLCLHGLHCFPLAPCFLAVRPPALQVARLRVCAYARARTHVRALSHARRRVHGAGRTIVRVRVCVRVRVRVPMHARCFSDQRLLS